VNQHRVNHEITRSLRRMVDNVGAVRGIVMYTEPRGERKMNKSRPFRRVARTQPAAESQTRWKRTPEYVQRAALNGSEAHTVPMMIFGPDTRIPRAAFAWCTPTLVTRLHHSSSSVSRFFLVRYVESRLRPRLKLEVPTKEMAGIVLSWSSTAAETTGLAKAALCLVQSLPTR